MHTLCPDCKKQHQITVDELRISQGMIHCTNCSSMFDALEFLNEKKITQNSDVSAPEYISTPTTSILNKLTPYWGIAYTFCIALFIFQIYFFEGYNLTQSKIIRPWLEKSCSLLNCQLPQYKNLSEFTILHGSFEPTENEYYIFKTSFTNQSAFEQKHPSIKLTLLNFNGQPFAERIFYPQNYLKQLINIIQPEMSAEISMEIATPKNNIGGYRFEFI